MKDKIIIDIVSDIVCPWCLIGYKRMEQAIQELGIQDQVELEWQPFELNPQMPQTGQNLQEHLAEKYGSTPEQNLQSRLQLTQLGAELDFKFDFFDDMRMPNTREAHILLDYAKEFGLQTELNLRLVAAFFTDHKDLSDRQILSQELKAVGLDAEQALEKLDETIAHEEIETKEAYWRSLGISAVPTIVFNRKSAVTGAQSTDVYKQVFEDLLG